MPKVSPETLLSEVVARKDMPPDLKMSIPDACEDKKRGDFADRKEREAQGVHRLRHILSNV